MSKISNLFLALEDAPKTWLVTGVAGFIGSNLLEQLLKINQNVIGIDNFVTGHQKNLDEVKAIVPKESWARFRFVEGDISDFETCEKWTANVDFVLHQAALGSVPRSIEQPLNSHRNNVDGHVNMLWASQKNKVKRFVYASSSSVYGDDEQLPKIESRTGEPLSPYAVTKAVDELYSKNFHRVYDLQTVGLRYFNVFGRRQDPEGPYAAVIPRWIKEILTGNIPVIFGDGETSRDFCYVDNVVQANLLAAAGDASAGGEVFNVAVGDTTTLTDLFGILMKLIHERKSSVEMRKAIYQDFRPGDIRHSFAEIAKAKKVFGYQPEFSLTTGLEDCIDWYLESLS